MAAGFHEAGAARLILAGVVQSRAERAGYEAAVGVPLTVCRLVIDPSPVRVRLRRRHSLDPSP
ncbi:hypothetical protein [Actinoplanes sp. G11-F43]|uniref:hypothetical protein n=1 Tax=Actinoplanes sp. G11-F43 TaxID=3424130 RepID=UPI003D33D840